jgi:hypothetical protein
VTTGSKMDLHRGSNSGSHTHLFSAAASYALSLPPLPQVALWCDGTLIVHATPSMRRQRYMYDSPTCARRASYWEDSLTWAQHTGARLCSISCRQATIDTSRGSVVSGNRAELLQPQKPAGECNKRAPSGLMRA